MQNKNPFKERYYQLIDEICAEAKIDDPQSLYENCSFLINDVAFTMAHMDAIFPENAVLYADFGEPPVEQRALALQRLLESNLLTYCDADAPSFAFNAETGHVILMARMPLEKMTGDMAAFLMYQLADYVAVWRKTYFLNRDEGKAVKAKSSSGRTPMASALHKSLNTAE